MELEREYKFTFLELKHYQEKLKQKNLELDRKQTQRLIREQTSVLRSIKNDTNRNNEFLDFIGKLIYHDLKNGNSPHANYSDESFKKWWSEFCRI